MFLSAKMFSFSWNLSDEWAQILIYSDYCHCLITFIFINFTFYLWAFLLHVYPLKWYFLCSIILGLHNKVLVLEGVASPEQRLRVIPMLDSWFQNTTTAGYCWAHRWFSWCLCDDIFMEGLKKMLSSSSERGVTKNVRKQLLQRSVKKEGEKALCVRAEIP